MADCPTCEYHKQRAQLWRDEVYRLGGHPLPERKKEWVGLMEEEVEEVERWVEFKEEGSGRIPIGKLVAYISEKLRSKNT